jgi:hypothetical protein
VAYLIRPASRRSPGGRPLRVCSAPTRLRLLCAKQGIRMASKLLSVAGLSELAGQSTRIMKRTTKCLNTWIHEAALATLPFRYSGVIPITTL